MRVMSKWHDCGDINPQSQLAGNASSSYASMGGETRSCKEELRQQRREAEAVQKHGRQRRPSQSCLQKVCWQIWCVSGG